MSGAFPEMETLRAGGKRLLSRVLTRIEVEAHTLETATFLDAACSSPHGYVLGLTGPPGVGKSTLTDALIRNLRKSGRSVAVLAIDPSSSLTGGALLGDRTRLTTDPEDAQIFVRSMAARDRLGGLSDHSVAAIAVLRAVYDYVIVETVGIGQSEGDLKTVADTGLLCIQPGSGDSLQFMKAGIMELPDIVAVTKSDMGPAARRAASDVAGALTLTGSAASTWKVPVCLISSRTGDGLAQLVELVLKHKTHLEDTGRLSEKRQSQHEAWCRDMVQTAFGSAGLKALDAQKVPGASVSADRPFASYHEIALALTERLER